MNFENIKNAVQTIEMPDEMRQRILQNHYSTATRKKRIQYIYYGGAVAAAVILLSVILVWSPWRGSGNPNLLVPDNTGKVTPVIPTETPDASPAPTQTPVETPVETPTQTPQVTPTEPPVNENTTEIQMVDEGPLPNLKKIQSFSVGNGQSQLGYEYIPGFERFPDTLSVKAFCVTHDGYMAFVDQKNDRVSIFYQGNYCGGFSYTSPGQGVLSYFNEVFYLMDQQTFTVFDTKGTVLDSEDAYALLEEIQNEEYMGKDSVPSVPSDLSWDSYHMRFQEDGTCLIYRKKTLLCTYQNGELTKNSDQTKVRYRDTIENGIGKYADIHSRRLWTATRIKESDRFVCLELTEDAIYFDYTRDISYDSTLLFAEYLQKYDVDGNLVWQLPYEWSTDISNTDFIQTGQLYLLRYEEEAGQYTLYQVDSCDKSLKFSEDLNGDGTKEEITVSYTDETYVTINGQPLEVRVEVNGQTYRVDTPLPWDGYYVTMMDVYFTDMDGDGVKDIVLWYRHLANHYPDTGFTVFLYKNGTLTQLHKPFGLDLKLICTEENYVMYWNDVAYMEFDLIPEDERGSDFKYNRDDYELHLWNVKQEGEQLTVSFCFYEWNNNKYIGFFSCRPTWKSGVWKLEDIQAIGG